MGRAAMLDNLIVMVMMVTGNRGFDLAPCRRKPWVVYPFSTWGFRPLEGAYNARRR